MPDKKAPLILVVDDEPDVGMIFHRVLGEAGYDVVSAASGNECLRALKKQSPELVFLDLRMPGMDGVETLRRLRETHPDLTVVIMTAYQTVGSAVETMRLGAYDYLIKPLETDKVLSIAKQALALGKVSGQAPAAAKAIDASQILPAGSLVAASEEMKRTYAMLEKVAPTDMTVLILGESGTGKEVFARSIHRLSARKDKPFVVVDCAALPESLIESELFGYEKGAFTGADVARAGKFESAQEGTLFLDEIGNLPLSVQVKLLRFLQEPVIERLGARKGPLRIDVRIIAATNVDLEKGVRNGTFREDLYHRLKVFLLQLPPLRSRGPEDMESLVRMFVETYRQKLNKPKLSIAPETIQLLKAYSWPGNIRELQNALSSASLLADDVIQPIHLPMSVQGANQAVTAAPKASTSLTDVISRVEREHIATTLKDAGGDVKKAAQALGLDADALADKIKTLGLS
jgi:DNA-binding NtrC family response regulator